MSTFGLVPASARKSPETDKKGKAIEAQTPENWKNKTGPIQLTSPPSSIQACPALRAPGSTRAFKPRAAPHQKKATGKNANGTHT